MPKRLRPIAHEDRLSVIDHLDELRSRLIVCGIVLAIAFGLCFWQSSRLLNWLNRPLPAQKQNQTDKLGGVVGDNVSTGQHFERIGADASKLARLPDSGLSNQARALMSSLGTEATNAGRALPQTSPKTQPPVTLGVGEPFTVSLTVAFYAALLIALPVLLYELYAFIIPALSPEEKRVAQPVIWTAPVLFAAGAVFTYFIVLPAAVKFLNGYNSSHFQNLIQAKPVYTFEVMTMGAIGLAFEMPLLLLGLRAAGVINGSTLIRHWRYATVIIAVIAAAMPGADPVTTGLETAPLVVLFLASIVLLKLADRRDARREAAELQHSAATLGGE